MDSLKLGLVAGFKENYKRVKFRTEPYSAEEGDAFERLRNTHNVQIEMLLSGREAFWSLGFTRTPLAST